MAEEETKPETASPVEPAQEEKVAVKVINRSEEILDPTMDPVDRVGRMARLCYRTEVKEGEVDREVHERIIRACIKSGHESVLEHGIISVYIPVNEVHDSWKIMEKLTNQKGHRVDFRHVWEAGRVEAQNRYLAPFMDPEIEARHAARFEVALKNDGMTNLMPVVAGNVRAWRLAMRQKMFIATNMRHDPLAFAVNCRIIQILSKQWPVFFADLAEEVEKFGTVYQQSLPEREPIRATILDKLPKDRTSTLDAIVDYCFDTPNDFYAEQAAACASLSVIFTTERAMSHQLVRHRKDVGYSQESQRYVNYDKRGYEVIALTAESAKKYADRKLIDNYDLGTIKTTTKWYQKWIASVTSSFQSYHDLLEIEEFGDTNGQDAEALKLPPETCRGVLPNDTATRIGVTWFLHDSYVNFCHWRLDKHAQYAIRSQAARVFVNGLLADLPFFNIIDPNVILEWLNQLRDQKMFEHADATIEKAAAMQKDRVQKLEAEIQKERERLIAAAKQQEDAWKKEQAERKKILDTGAAIQDMPAPEGGSNIVVGKIPEPDVKPEDVRENPPTVTLMSTPKPEPAAAPESAPTPSEAAPKAE